jgi:hypothetical protein
MHSFHSLVAVSSLLLSFSTAAPAEAAAADGWSKVEPPSDFQLKRDDSFDSWVKVLDGALPNQKISDIIHDLNHPTTSTAPLNVPHFQDSYSWDASASFNDRTTKKWYPQGITTSSDALQEGKYGGFDITLVSWHSNTDDEIRGVSPLSPS